MPNPINLTHEEYTARLFTYTAIQSAQCHLAWPPEFCDLAMDYFPGKSFAQLVENETFHLGCTAILQSGYPSLSFDVSAKTLVEVGYDPRLPLLDAYLRRELGRFGKRWNTTIRFKHRAECLSILLLSLVDIMSRFRVAKIDGDQIVARRCTNYCSAFMTGAWRPLQKLLFVGKGDRPPLEEERVSTDSNHVCDPFDVFSLNTFKDAQQVWRRDGLLGELTRIIGEELNKSGNPEALRGLLTGTLATKDVVGTSKRSPTWVSARLVSPFVRSVQTRLHAAGLTVRVAGKADLRILRKAIPACLPGFSGALTTATSDQFPETPRTGLNHGR